MERKNKGREKKNGEGECNKKKTNAEERNEREGEKYMET